MSAFDRNRRVPDSSPLSHISHNSRSLPMRPMPGNYQSDAPSESISSLDTNNDDFAQSTRPNLEDDERIYGRLRTTAKKRGQYSLPQPQDPIRSSALRNSFKDFTKDFSDEKTDMDQDSSLELEMGRGLPRNSRGTPSKLNQSYMASDVILDMGFSSPFDAKTTPRAKQVRKGLATDADMRKNAQLRRASSQKPNGVPQRTAALSGQHTYTEDSFALPDVTGLSKIIDTAMETRPQVSKYRSRQHPSVRAMSNHAEQFMPVDSVPVSDENKWQMLALQSLHERIKSLEQDNSQLTHQCQHYKTNVEELEAELNIERTMRKADSALGSDDGRQNKRSEILKLQVNNVRLEAENRRLSRRVQELEEQADNSENLTKRMVTERNKLARDLSATQDQQSLKVRHENTLLKKENKILRERVDELQVLNDELRAHLDETQDRHDEATQEWTQKVQGLELKTNEGDTAVIAENQTLRLQLDQLRSTYDSDVQKLRKEADSRRTAARAAHAEYANLQSQHQQLKKDLQHAKERQEKGQRQAEIKSVSDARSQQRLNDELRRNNDELRAELAQLKTEIISGDHVDTQNRSRSTYRRKSAPLNRQDPPIGHNNIGNTSDPESTTDISRPLPAIKTARTKPVQQDEADTYLTLMSPEEIMRIRRAVEQEYAAKRGIFSQSQSGVDRQSSFKATTRPKTPTEVLAAEHSGHSQPFRHHGDGGNGRASTQQDTQQSRRSSIVTRRRTVNDDEAGMTSAFIIPDITLGVSNSRPNLSTSARNVLSNLAPHSPRQCTVCHRIVSAQNPATAPPSPKISTPIPVSKLVGGQNEIDATLRPSEPPLKALSRVIRQLADEIAHLKLELHTIERRLAAHNPARSKRERDLLHEAIEGLNKSIQIKSNQMYSLYDVLEGHKSETGHKESSLATATLEDDITDDVREILEELKAGRRVTIQSPAFSQNQGQKVSIEDGSEDNGERPWEGFSETGSLASHRF